MKRFHYWEIDTVRGLAIVTMVIYHIFLDLWFFGLRTRPPYLQVLEVNVAVIFIIISGISLQVSYMNSEKIENFFKGTSLRSGVVLICAIFITLVTFVLIPERYVRFGILHLIGLSMFLGMFFARFKYYNLIFAFLIIIVGNYTYTHFYDSNIFAWLGFRVREFDSIDYFPLLPWFGYFLLGLFLGSIFYLKRRRRFNIIDLSDNFIIKMINVAGRNSLFIYLIHQPVIVFVFWLMGLLSFSDVIS